MLPFHPTFRRLLSRYVPQLSKEDLDRHESLIALRQQLKREGSLVSSKLKDINSKRKDINSKLIVINSKLKDINQKLRAIDPKNAKLQKEYDQLQKEYDQLQKDLSHVELQEREEADYSSKLKHLNSKLKNLDSKLKNSSSKLEILNQKLKAITLKCPPKLEADYDQARVDYVQTQADYDQTQNRYDQLLDNLCQVVDHEKEAAGEAVKILKPFKREFNSVQRLYVTSRRLALSHGRYLQIPTSFADFGKFVWFNLAFRWQQVANFFITSSRIKYLIRKQELLRWPAAAALAGILTIGTFGFNSLFKAVEIPEAPVLKFAMETEESRPGQFTADIEMGVHFQEPFEAQLEITPTEVRTNVSHELDSAVVRIRVKVTENHASARESKVAINPCETCDSIDLVSAKIKPGSGLYSKTIVATCKINAQLPQATKLEVRPYGAFDNGAFDKISTSRNVFAGSATVVFETKMVITPVRDLTPSPDQPITEKGSI